MSKAAVKVFITGYNGSVMDRGEFRWRLEIEEQAALRVVLDYMSDDNLRRVQTIELVPVAPANGGEQVFIPWLKHRKTYDFSGSNPPPPQPAPAAAPAAAAPVAVAAAPTAAPVAAGPA